MTEDAVGSSTLTGGRPKAPFPYVPLHDVTEMVGLIEKRGHSCRLDELAADLDQQKTSGAFRGRLAAGRLFGAVRAESHDLVLTTLGLRMCAPDAKAAALAEAFLTVPLYKAIYDKYAGGKLPPSEGIEAEMRRLGVPDKQVQRARQVFARSADLAGYFGSGRDRLVRPSASTISARRGPGEPVSTAERPRVSQAEAVSMAEHPLIQGLVAQLPSAGDRFTPQQRKRWLDAARINLELIYAADDEQPLPEASPNGFASAQRQPS
jgi:hypothetical protein